MPKKAAGSSGKSKSKKDAKGSLAPLLGSKHKPPTAWQAFSKAARKKLLGWLHPVVKYNGRTLQPSNAVLARFMVSSAHAAVLCGHCPWHSACDQRTNICRGLRDCSAATMTGGQHMLVAGMVLFGKRRSSPALPNSGPSDTAGR
jgi:hypothetical protein